VDDHVAGRQALGLGGDDLPHRAAGHRLVEPEGRHVGLHVVHAAAHVRVDRHVAVADQHLARARVGHRDLDEAEVAVLGLTVRAGGQPDLP
jgi:hypothetical protein